MSTNLTLATKIEKIDKAKSVIFLCLRDKVIREVRKETSVTSWWSKLELLYMIKLLAHRYS